MMLRGYGKKCGVELEKKMTLKGDRFYY